MEIYQIWAITALLFLFFELLTPSLFFLNLALGAVFASMAAYFSLNIVWQTGIFIVCSFLCIVILRPMLMKLKQGQLESDIEGKYTGLTAQVIEEIGAEGTDGVGKIKIYDEIWRAKSTQDCVIPVNSTVKITGNESLLMFVEKI